MSSVAVASAIAGIHDIALVVGLVAAVGGLVPLVVHFLGSRKRTRYEMRSDQHESWASRRSDAPSAHPRPPKASDGTSAPPPAAADEPPALDEPPAAAASPAADVPDDPFDDPTGAAEAPDDDTFATEARHDALDYDAFPSAPMSSDRADVDPEVGLDAEVDIAASAEQEPPPSRRASSPVTSGRGGSHGGSGGSQGGSSVASPERTLQRTPHLDAPSRIPTAENATFDVTVRVDEKRYGAAERGEALRIDLPRGVDKVTVGVLLTPSVHFAVDEPYAPLVIRAHDEEAVLPPFTVRVTHAEEEEPDEAGITALFVYNGRACGSATRRWTWDRAEPTGVAIVDTDPEPTAVHVDVTDEQPDLTVYVTRPTNDGINFQVAVQTPLLDGYIEPTKSELWALPELARTFVASQIDRIIFGDSPSKRRTALLGAGIAFWEAAPPLFQDVLWQLIDNKTPPRNIFIASEEPALPWELMVPSRLDDDGIAVDREPLGVEFPIGRWVASVGRRKQQRIVPNQRIVVSRSWVVAPTYTSRAPIDAKAETQFLKAYLHGALAQPASEDELDRRFGQTPAELVHFVCHGETTPDADVLILDGEVQMLATDVRVKEGFKALCRQGRPLIFINACNAGNLTPAIGGATGFPKTFGDLGARAVIAPLWSVTDTKAGPIAVDLYARALNERGRTLAELVRDIRARAYHDPEFDDSFAAYCLFGDPLLTLEAAAPQ